MKRIRVASVQFEHVAGDKAANLAKIEGFVRRAAAQGVRLAVFPECCITGYWFLRDLSREELKAPGQPSWMAPRRTLSWTWQNSTT